MKEILITDTLFILPKHEQKLIDAGFKVTRIPKPDASELELCEAIKGKSGYILGGIEKVTPKVIGCADKLKVIAFTGAGYKEHITAYKEATQKGIAIANTPGGNAESVAEYALTLILGMTRNIFELGRTGKKNFETTHSLSELSVGIVGLGHIGRSVAHRLKVLGAKKIYYFNPGRIRDLERTLGIEYASLEDLLKASDIVTLHASKDAGESYIGAKQLALMKDGSLLVNASFAEAVDAEALYKELKSGRIRAAFDKPPKKDFSGLPLNVWFSSNSQTAFNTVYAIDKVSEMAVDSVINVIKNRKNQNIVNADFRNFSLK